MADAVTARAITVGPRNYIIHLTNISDGTGESLVRKVVLANQKTDDGFVPTKFSIKKVQWTIQGFTSVRLLWDHTTSDVAVVMGAGVGKLDWKHLGSLVDPKSAGGTGDLMLTTAGLVAGATYDITVEAILS
jgi:hypothetical protein